MKPLFDLIDLFSEQASQWRSLRLADLQFWHLTEARMALMVLLALTLILVVLRSLVTRRIPRGVLLPALPASLPRPRAALAIHVPLVLFVLGLPFFVLAYADPFTPTIRSDSILPGRRIAIMIDASSSMRKGFSTQSLDTGDNEGAFYAAIAAVQQFMKLRVEGKYHDLIGLVEFGTSVYVVMPFTSDYDNALLSLSLIGDPQEFESFPEKGTIIAAAIDESIELYKAFNFLEASGNLMMILTDGEDVNTKTQTRSLDDILKRASEAKIPVYFVRTNYQLAEGGIMAYTDDLWRASVAKTGGRFYVASDEASLLRAIRDINRAASGSIQMKLYSQQQPRFEVFTLIAWAFWTAAAGLKLGVPQLRKL